MVKPADGAVLDTERISEPTDNKPEWQNDHSIEDCQQDAGLEVSDFVTKTGPGLPSTFNAFPHE